jgi:SAM-dependent methyltransferase
MAAMSARISEVFRYYARQSLYGLPLSGALRHFARKRAQERNRPEAWDQQLRGPKAAYLRRTFSITARDSLTVALLELSSPSTATVWDIGCGKGTLAKALKAGGCVKYLGVDISLVAVSAAIAARQDEPAAYPTVSEFREGRMGECRPLDKELVDVVVFNEVLYYLPGPEDAIAEVERVIGFVRPRGVVSISMKDDAKSSLFIKALSKRFEYRHSVLVQEQSDRASFRVRIDNRRPAYLITLFGRLGESEK